MTTIALTERESLILNSLVESYVTNAAPVGSRTLAKKHDLGISPATIRNVMNDLEDLIFEPTARFSRSNSDGQGVSILRR